MPSHSAVAPRRTPQQPRGRRRLEGFLRSAAALIAESGYERATMSAIAQRADSCIGSLYQYFPNKLAIAEALRAEYVRSVEQSWAALAVRAAVLGPGELAARMVDLYIEAAQRHPELLALLEVPPTAQTRARRELIRSRIAAVLLVHRRGLTRASATRIAAVVQQISKGLLHLYAQAEGTDKAAVVQEFKAVLAAYLAWRLGPRQETGTRGVSAAAVTQIREEAS